MLQSGFSPHFTEISFTNLYDFKVNEQFILILFAILAVNLCCCYFLLEILFPPASIYNFLWISLSFFQPPSSSSRPLNNGVHHRLALSYFWFPCALSLGDLIHRFASVSFSTPNTQTNIIPNHFSVYEKLHTTIICHIYTYI